MTRSAMRSASGARSGVARRASRRFGKAKPAAFQPVQRREMRRDVRCELRDDERLVLLLAPGAGEAKDAKVLGEPRLLRHRLGAHRPVTRGQPDDGAGVGAQPPRALERQHVRRIRDDFGTRAAPTRSCSGSPGRRPSTRRAARAATAPPPRIRSAARQQLRVHGQHRPLIDRRKAGRSHRAATAPRGWPASAGALAR